MNTELKHFLIAGAGALGSAVGGMLARAGHPVTFLGRDPHMTLTRTHGLDINGIWGNHHVKGIETVVNPESILTSPDIIIISTKCFHTRNMMTMLQHLITPETRVISLQNGIGNEEIIAETAGCERTIGGMVIIGFEIPEPGSVNVTVQADSIKLGRLDGSEDPAIQEISRLFQLAEIPCEAVTNIQAHLWSKALYNAALNPLGAILRVPYGKLTAPQSWSIIQQLLHEAFACLNAAGIHVFWKTAAEYLTFLREHQIPPTARHRASMLQDIEHHMPTEINFINGAILHLAKTHNIPVPVNRTLVSIIKAMEPESN